MVEILQVTVNGETRELSQGTTTLQLLNLLGVTRESIAVELNREIVPRAHHADRQLRNGDIVEIVTFVGGG